VTLADFQKYLRALADALAAAKGPSKELTEAANALAPFAHHTMADFAAFLRIAETTYRETGRLPAPVQPKTKKEPKPKKEPVTVEQLHSAIRSIRDRIEQREPLTRLGVGDELARFEALSKASLDSVVSGLGYKAKPKSKKAAVEMIADRLLAGPIADARAQV
jgi:hypothetical protein